ncbi:MAG: hypothetical protein J6U54_05555 [Clostridiales bacterium]|nr:hypothetical protein [Clostridiales bacterium]
MSAHDSLMHYGTKHHSGRYPWGSGDRPYQSGGGPFSKKKASKRTVVATYNNGEKKTVKIRKQKNASDTVRATARAVYNNRDQFTNKELDDIVKRLKNENDLIQLGTPQKSLGRKWIESVLGDATKKTATSALSGVMKSALKEIGVPVDESKNKK